MADVDWRTAAGEILRERRRAAGLTQRALAKLAGVSQAEVARIESHDVQPSLLTLGRLLDELGTELRPVETGVAVAVAAEIKAVIDTGELSNRGVIDCLRSAAGIVDAAQRSSPDSFRRSVAAPPATTDSPGFDALLAALVEDSCEMVGVEPPPWVNDAWRFVDEWYPSGVETLREAAREESRRAFARHGVFVLAGEFDRV